MNPNNSDLTCPATSAASSEKTLQLIGKFYSFVEDMLVIESDSSKPLDLETKVYTENGVFVGLISDVFGQKETPFYIVSETQTNPKDFVNFYFCPEESKFLDVAKMEEAKGCDASNYRDEEISEEDMEFSDDEKEQLFKKKLKNKIVIEEDSKRNVVKYDELY